MDVRYSVEVEGLRRVVARLRGHSSEEAGFVANYGTMQAASGAFSTPADNQGYSNQLAQIVSQHDQIVRMYDNVLDRLEAVARNYDEADGASSLSTGGPHGV
ncbi:hypothetical protein LLS1_24240 [Leifsonia sp. LS1]|uniref:hypothetical protein n=1 Tax=Leifsonia sp. LS1 TaxID=2828483 RepID=UPI001CFEB4DB|nr:hypothetical protein [Leifsonia sp. LS1]GIT80755.1 hypothetical protein LLS1_24240 [Leifsonia sp. LS1]